MTFRDPERAKAYMRKWRKENSAIVRVANANARAKRFGAEGRITSAEVRDVLKVDACAYCGRSGNPSGPREEWITIDHIVPLSRGGANARENLQALCWACNASKFTGDRISWSSAYDACIECATTERRFAAHGLCTQCYDRDRARQRESA